MVLNRRVLFFFPHNPYPPRSGAHKRCLEMIAAFKEMGCDVTLFSSRLSVDTPWTQSSVESLKERWVRDVLIYGPRALDYPFILTKRLARLLRSRLSPTWDVLMPPRMREQFERALHSVAPDIVFMSYPFWDRLLDHQRCQSMVRVIDTFARPALSDLRWRALRRYLRGSLTGAGQIDHRVLEEDFFERLDLSPDPEDYPTYDRYNYTLALSEGEAKMIKRHTRDTTVLVVPITQEPTEIPNRYTGPALFSTGPSPFNLQGYLYFVRRVLPRVQQRARSFSLQVTGYWSEALPVEKGILLGGFLPDLRAVYEVARFAVCPVFGATGPQVKIVEAMAHGLAVIILRVVAEGTPIRHGVNGFIASTADEFADYVIKLWNHPELCRQMGRAARDTIAAEFSRSRLVQRLSAVLDA